MRRRGLKGGAGIRKGIRRTNGSVVASSVLAGLLLVACASTPAGVHAGEASVPVDQTPVGHAQQAFRYPGGWETSCSAPNTCQTEPIGSFVLATPSAPAFVDMHVTATLDYKVSQRDRADVTLTYTQSPTPGPLQTMPPGTYRLASPGQNRISSTTLTWGRTNLDAQGQEYYIQVGVVAHDSDGDGQAMVSGTKVVLVVDMWAP